MITRDQLEKEHVQQSIYKFALDATKKNQSEFTQGQFVLNKTNSKYTEFEAKSNDLSKWGQGNVIVQVNHRTENVEIFEQDIDGDNWSKKTKTYVLGEKLSEILKEYGLSKEAYKEAYKEKALEDANKEIEEDKYKENYKDLVLDRIEEQKETAKEKIKYKELFKKGILKLINAEPEKPMKKQVNKEDGKANREKNTREMKEFEKAHSFETIYQLRKEVFKELKEMNLTEQQQGKLLKLEKNLDKQKQEYDKNHEKDNSKKNDFEKDVAQQKKKENQKSKEMER